MRSVHVLLGRLVRTQAGHWTPWPAAAAKWPARALHDFGDSDKFGDLKQPLEKPREHTAKEAVQSESLPPLAGRVSDRSRYSEHSERGGYRRHRDRHESGLAGNDRLEDSGLVVGWQDWDHAAEQDSLTPLQRRDQTAAGQMGQSAWTEQLHPDEQPHTTLTNTSKPSSTADSNITPGDTSVTTATTAVTTGTTGSVTNWELVPDDADDVAAEQLQQTLSQIPKLGITCHAYARKFKRMIKNGKVSDG